jgi:hypothetical protein
MNRRTFIRTIVSAAAALHAVPLLDKVAAALPNSYQEEISAATTNYYALKGIALDHLRKTMRLSSSVRPKTMPLKAGETITFTRYEMQ